MEVHFPLYFLVLTVKNLLLRERGSHPLVSFHTGKYNFKNVISTLHRY